MEFSQVLLFGLGRVLLFGLGRGLEAVSRRRGGMDLVGFEGVDGEEGLLPGK